MNLTSFNEIKTYWDKRPCNLNHSKNRVGTKEYFNEVEKKNILLNIIFQNLLIFLIGKIRKF